MKTETGFFVLIKNCLSYTIVEAFRSKKKISSIYFSSETARDVIYKVEKRKTNQNENN